MRKLAFSLLLCGAAALPRPASSQQAAPASPQDYVCAFSGDCADRPADDATDPNAPPSQGRPRLGVTRGFSLSAPDEPGRPNPVRRPSPAAGQRRMVQGAAPRRPAAAAGQRVNLSLNFETGSAKLTPAAVAQARVFGQALMLPQLVTMHFRIEGHTDSTGNRARNLDLSQRRAQSVADFLVAMGVQRDRLDVRGYGPDQPLPGTGAASPENRRVEAVRVS